VEPAIQLALMQGLVRRVPHVRTDTVAITAIVAIVLVVRGDPAGARAAALEHAADFLAEGAREADGERVGAHASAPDGVLAAARGAVCGGGLAVAQEEVDAAECGDDDDREHYYEREEGSKKRKRKKK